MASQTILYGIQCGEFIKIGITANLKYRLEAFRLCNPHPLKVAIRRHIPGGYARIVEIRAHQLLAEYAVGREWFNCDLATAKKGVDEAIVYGMARMKEQQMWMWHVSRDHGRRTGRQIARDIETKHGPSLPTTARLQSL